MDVVKVDDQIRDVFIKETPHANIRRQCLLEADPTLNNVLAKAATYIQTAETDKVLKGESSAMPTTNQITATYKQTQRWKEKR